MQQKLKVILGVLFVLVIPQLGFSQLSKSSNTELENAHYYFNNSNANVEKVQNNLPSNAGCTANIINSDTTICTGSSMLLTAISGSAASSVSYLWSNGATTPTVTVSPTISTLYYCTINDGTNTCRDSVRVNVNTTVPGIAGSINGLTDVCTAIGTANNSTAVTYKVSKVANTTLYYWSLPENVMLLSGQGDTSIRVSFLNSFVSGAISIIAINACGVSNSVRSLTVYKRIAATPGTVQKEFSPVSIAAVTNVCGVASSTYRIKKVTYATTYIWRLLSGANATITRLGVAGVNDTAAIVTFNSGFTKDTISIVALTACSVSAARTCALNATYLPPAVTAISGSTTPCIGNSIQYTATASSPTSTQSSISLYRWTKPNYTSITSANADSSSITLRYNAGFIGGSIISKGQSTCGVTGSSKTVLLQYLPPTPTSITSSTSSYNACFGNSITYTVVVAAPNTAQRAATLYRWTKPNNTTITAAAVDSSSITLLFNTGYMGGALTVKGQTACGATGTSKSQTLTHTGCAAGTKITPTVNSILGSNDEYQLSPNPTRNHFTLRINNKNSNITPTHIRILDLQGRTIQTNILASGNQLIFGETLKPGVYLIEIITGKEVKTMSVVKQ